MIALDTNIIIHLLVKSQKEHTHVKRWFESIEGPLATTPTNVGEVLRLLTHPRVFPRPVRIDDAVDCLDALLENHQIRVVEEEEHWWRHLGDLAKKNATLKGNEIFDARVALCLRYNGIKEICTFDADFSKYPFLKVIVP